MSIIRISLILTSPSTTPTDLFWFSDGDCVRYTSLSKETIWTLSSRQVSFRGASVGTCVTVGAKEVVEPEVGALLVVGARDKVGLALGA